MNRILNALFGTGDLSFGAEGVRFGFERPLPAWGWFTVVVLAGALSAWSYRRQAGRRRARGALACARGLVLLLLAVLIAGPRLTRPRERIEPDWVVVLLDRSASLTIEDAPGGGSRDAQLRDAARAALRAFDLEPGPSRRVVWLGFGGGAFELSGAPAEVGLPEGQRTSLRTAFDEALRRTAGRPLSGIVAITDGRSLDVPSPGAMRRLAAERVRVIFVPLGGPGPLTDLALGEPDAPSEAFISDLVPVRIRLDRLGGGEAAGATVRLIDLRTGLVLDQRRVEAGGARTQEITLGTRPASVGEQRWRVEVVPEGTDLSARNNTRDLSLTLVDRPLRVAYFDGYPRWEFRYLKNLIIREPTILSSSLLLAADRQFLQESEVEIDGFPRSRDEWRPIDVVIIGDLRAELMTTTQAEQLREQVASRGAGLLWIAGEGATPRTWRDSPLADLLPFTFAPGADVPAAPQPVVLRATPQAADLGLWADDPGALDDGWLKSLGDPASGWSLLRWAQEISPGQLKPTAEVLAEGWPASSGGAPVPLVISMRYGLGRIVYIATDETWRWRFGRGEGVLEKFWVPLIRLLARESLGRGGRSAILTITPRFSKVENPVRLGVRLVDQALIDTRPQAIRLTIRRLGPGDAPPVEVLLGPEQGAEGAISFGTTWVPTQPGTYRVEAGDPALAGAGVTGEVIVSPADDELLHPEADHALLSALADQLAPHGRLIAPPDIPGSTGAIPRRETRVELDPETRALWDSPLALALLLTLLAGEWVGRRIVSLP